MPGALDGAKLDDLVVTVDHAGVPLGRFPTTLELEDRADGMHWSVSPPESRADVREAVERGDLKAGSWRMRVKRDSWDGDLRRVHEIAELRDVSIVTAPAYESAVVELRSQPKPAPGQEDNAMADTATNDSTTTTTATETIVEDRAAQTVATNSTGGLSVEDRVTVTREAPRASLMEEFRSAGFPGETATISWQAFENRAVTWSGSVDNIAKARNTASDLGYDQRYIWPAFPRQGVDSGVTSVDVASQTARTLATSANTVRAIDAVTNKPETASTVTIAATAMKQVATVQSGIPNVYLESQAISHSPEIATLVPELEATRWTGRPGYPIKSMVGMALAKSIYAVPTWTRLVALVAEHASLRAAFSGSTESVPSVYAVRGLDRVKLHADLTILAKLSCALSRARRSPRRLAPTPRADHRG